MILGAKARYAVMAMVDLAGRDAAKPVVLADLAEHQSIPLPYLEQIFAQLRKASLVESVRGPKGGYTLAHPADRINIATIIEAVDEPIKMTRCNEHGEQTGCLPSNAKCTTHALWDGLGAHIYEYLAGKSLQDVAQAQT